MSRGWTNDLNPSDIYQTNKLLTKEDKEQESQVQDLILGNLTNRAERIATRRGDRTTESEATAPSEPEMNYVTMNLYEFELPKNCKPILERILDERELQNELN